MNYPSSPSSESSSYDAPENKADENTKNEIDNNYNNNKYEFYSDRPTEIDYDPPEFIPPTDDEQDDDDDDDDEEHNDDDDDDDDDDWYNNEDKNEMEETDTTSPNMYERKNDYDYNYYDNEYNKTEREQGPFTPSGSESDHEYISYKTWLCPQCEYKNSSIYNICTMCTNGKRSPFFEKQTRGDPPPPIKRNNNNNNNNNKYIEQQYKEKLYDKARGIAANVLLQKQKQKINNISFTVPSYNNNKYNKYKQDVSINDNGELFKDNKIMLKIIDRLEKRQTKIDKKKKKINTELNKLQSQKDEIMRKLQFDKKIMNERFKMLEIEINEQYLAQKYELNDYLSFLKKKDKEFTNIHTTHSQKMWMNDRDILKSTKKESEKKIREFDNEIKKIRIIEPNLDYKSFLASKHAKYQDVVQNYRALNILFDDNDINNDNDDKLIFFDGYLSGVVPIKPYKVEVTLTKSYEKKNESDIDNNNNNNNNNDDNDDNDEREESSPSSLLSEMSIATTAKFNTIKNIRVMFEYNDYGKFYNKTLNILQHEIIIDLKNMKPFIVLIKPSINCYECKQYQNLKIYEGIIKVRSRNKNGWSSYKKQSFKLDENGYKLDENNNIIQWKPKLI